MSRISNRSPSGCMLREEKQGVSLVEPDGLLGGLTTTVLETALEAEMTEHFGYDKHAIATSAWRKLPYLGWPM